jgi:predicted TIM-barrel fold metal-dependent hydrolase
MSMGISRREILGQAAAISVLEASGFALAAEPVARPPVVDTHLHCFAGRSDKRYPYHARAPYRPDVIASPEQLLRCMEGAGVHHAIVVHAEPYQDDHRYLEHCLAVGKDKLKGTALVFADRPGSVAQLPNLVKRLPIVAVRIHAYAPERPAPFGRPELRDLWTRAGELGIAVQIHLEPRYAVRFEPYIREFSDTKVIVDHLGRPFQGTSDEHAVVLRWSRFKNTVMKLSAAPAPETYPHRQIGPIIRQLCDAYGADRMIYGGGFGAGTTPESYRAAREHARSFIGHLSENDQAKILGGTAMRLFRFVN